MQAKNRQRNWGPTLRTAAASVLLAVAVLIPDSPCSVAYAANQVAPSDCVQSPTARCVIGLSQAAAATTVDAYQRAAAFVRIAGMQAATGAERAAQRSISLALSAAAKIDAAAFDEEPVLMGLPEDEAGRARAVVLSDIARILSILGESERAQATFLDAATTAEGIKSDRYRAQSLVAIAGAQLEVGAPDAARETLARVDLANDAEYLPGLPRIVQMQAKVGDVDGALVTAQRIGSALDGIQRDWALANVAGVQAATGDAKGTLATAESIEHPYVRMVAMHRIGVARARAGDIVGAWGAVRAIGEIRLQDLQLREGRTGSRDMEILQADTVIAIVNAHIADGTIEDAFAATEEMTDDFAFIEAHAAIARSQIAAGDLDAARGTAEAMCGWHYADRCVGVLTDLAVARAAAGHAEGAKRSLSSAQAVAEHITYGRERTRAFLALHAARMRMGDVEGARRAFATAVTAAEAFDHAHERAEQLIELGLEAFRIGDAESAARAFAAGLTAAADVEDTDKRVRAFVRVGLAWTEVGDDASAREAISSAVTAATAINASGWRAALLADIALSLRSRRLPAAEDPYVPF